MRLFKDTGNMEQSAYFGWQDERGKEIALYGLREGYKNSADDLVDIVLANGDNIKMLDTYIFPIMFSYRHCIELSLKHIFMRAYGTLPSGGHDLLKLWLEVENKVIKEIIKSERFIMYLENEKEDFVRYSLDGIKLGRIKTLIKELQEASMSRHESESNNIQIDSRAEVWRYLMMVDSKLFFNNHRRIDYTVLKSGINYIYETLDYIYGIVDDYLS